MKNIIFTISILCVTFGYAQRDSMIFNSSKELNKYRFGKSDLAQLTTGYLLDMEEEWTAGGIDTFLNLVPKQSSSMNGLLSLFNVLEHTDVRYSFEQDSLLFPVMDHYYSQDSKSEMHIPIYIFDFKFSHLNTAKRREIDQWTSEKPYHAFSGGDLEKKSFFYTSLFIDTVFHNNIHLYWNDATYLSNTDKKIASVVLQIGEQSIKLANDEHLDLMPYLNYGLINEIAIRVNFTDNNSEEQICKVHIDKNTKLPQYNEKNDENFSGQFGATGYGLHKLNFTVFYGCDDQILNKPFIMVAGWGSYIDNFWPGALLNWIQGWPTEEQELYHQWNQAGYIDELREAGYDVVVARFTPPNASIRKNVDKLKLLINWVNEQKALVGSNEENIILGYSAGALCSRLTLQEMEKEHLEHSGPHHHTKLFVSYDGENQGAHIPLGVQHATEYLKEYHNGPNIYALHYILNAPLSRELLHYFHTETGNNSNPDQKEHEDRKAYISGTNSWHIQANHLKNGHIPMYPSFSRNISISNGMNESRYEVGDVDHFPYPDQFGHVLFRTHKPHKKWHVQFDVPGGSTVFSYEKRTTVFSPWVMQMNAATSSSGLCLDNAPGGMVFIDPNPLTKVIQQMKKKISDNLEVYNPHTQFCFTPTIFTHDIHNFDAQWTGGKMVYSMKQNRLMFQSITDYENYLNSFGYPNNYSSFSSDYFGYPHIAHPNNHYQTYTPFDAVFSWSQNSEHILFNTCWRSDVDNHNEEWQRVYDDDRSTIVKQFILEEADHKNAYIQNKRYGWNAREDGIYRYKTDIVTLKNIYLGQGVTQRTDFKMVEFLSNSDTKLRAEQSIVFKPGTHIHAGATLHAKIEDYSCSSFQGMVVHTPTPTEHTSEERTDVGSADKEQQFIVYPNPSESTVSIKSQTNGEYAYFVYDFSGHLLYSGLSETITTFDLKEGIYLIKTQNNENTETHKVIVR